MADRKQGAGWSSGSSSAGHKAQLGPDNHVLLFRSLWTVSPLDASSAGFCFVWTYHHCAGSEASLMILILLGTNVQNPLFSLLMYFKIVLLSVQKQNPGKESCNSDFTILSTRTAKTAAVSSKQRNGYGFKRCYSGLSKKKGNMYLTRFVL